jgi:hypothetical protein
MTCFGEQYKSCETCAYWRKFDSRGQRALCSDKKDPGFCNRYPPQSGAFVTSIVDWCGEYTESQQRTCVKKECEYRDCLSQRGRALLDAVRGALSVRRALEEGLCCTREPHTQEAARQAIDRLQRAADDLKWP